MKIVGTEKKTVAKENSQTPTLSNTHAHTQAQYGRNHPIQYTNALLIQKGRKH